MADRDPDTEGCREGARPQRKRAGHRYRSGHSPATQSPRNWVFQQAPSPSFLAKLILGVFPQVRACAVRLIAYDLTAGCPAPESEVLVTCLLVAGEFGGHPAGSGPAAGDGVEEDGRAYSA